MQAISYISLMCQQPEASRRLTLDYEPQSRKLSQPAKKHLTPPLTPPPVTLILRVINIRPACFPSSTQPPPTPHVSRIFTAFSKFHGFRECNAHNKHGSLQWHCTYCHFQFHKCHFSLFHRFTGKHSGCSKAKKPKM